MKEWLIGTRDEPGLLAKRQQSVETFARSLGLTRAAVYNFLADTNRPSPETLAAICKELGVSYEEGLKIVEPRAAHRPASGQPRRTIPANQRRKYRNLVPV